MLFLWVVWNKNKNKFMIDQPGLENTFVVCVWICEFILRTIPTQKQ